MMNTTNTFSHSCLDKAYDLQLEELSLLEEEDISGANQVAMKRESVLHSDLPDEINNSEPKELVNKIRKLQELQNQISGMARKLRDDLQDELIRVRSENTRFQGYKQASKLTPLVNRFSRRG
ncbi:MAG: hypothetical protein ACQES5_01150 [Thermodesulfobacteriota bacterium]